MIKLDSELLSKIADLPPCYLDLSPSVLDDASKFIADVMGIKPTQENKGKRELIVITLLFIGYEWGKRGTLVEVEEGE